MKPSELLSDESKWTKGAFAEDRKGIPVHSKSDDAVKWCILGALNKCGCIKEQVKLEQIVMGNAAEFNDAPTTTFRDVRELLLKAGL